MPYRYIKTNNSLDQKTKYKYNKIYLKEDNHYEI